MTAHFLKSRTLKSRTVFHLALMLSLVGGVTLPAISEPLFGFRYAIATK